MGKILNLFGFSELQSYIAVFCLVIFLGNFLGGLLTSLVIAFAGPAKPRRMSERLSFRWSVFSELLMVIFAIYYHGVLIEYIEVSHVVYWAFALVAAPLLGFIGSQVTGLMFAKKIEGNQREYLRRLNAQRAAKREAAERRAKRAKAFNATRSAFHPDQNEE